MAVLCDTRCSHASPWCLLSPRRCRAQEPAGGSVAMAAGPQGHLSTYSLPPLPHSPCNGPLMFEPLHLLFLSSSVPQVLPRPLVGGSESDKCPGLSESLKNGRSGSGNWIGPPRGNPYDKMDPSSLDVNHKSRLMEEACNLGPGSHGFVFEH